MKSNLLVEAIRCSVKEKYFEGWVIVVNKEKRILKSLENSDFKCYMRSCEKPLQALCAYDLGIDAKYNISKADIALSYASHSGSADHVEQLKTLLIKTGIRKEQLHCGTHLPLDKKERLRLLKLDEEPDVLHNNCSAKHIFILACCLVMGWDMSGYTEFNHPVQLHINNIIQNYCQPDIIEVGIDGCSMPIHAMSLVDMGAGFAKYFDGTTPYAEQIADAVTEYPILAGGAGRIDSSIIQASKGKLLAKVGAEGLIIVTPRHSGEALVVKMASGDDYIRNKVVIEALNQLKWFDAFIDKSYIEPFMDNNIYNHAEKKIGQYQYKFSL